MSCERERHEGPAD